MALLRAVNLASHQRVDMGSLRRSAERAGFGDVRSLIASGNLVFSAPSMPVEEVTRRLERAVERDLGLSTPVLVRSTAGLAGALASNPFSEEARLDPSHLLVIYLRSAPTEVSWGALRAAVRGPEKVAGNGQHAFIYYATGVGRSRLTGAVIERHLQTVATGRNWATSSKLLEMAREIA